MSLQRSFIPISRSSRFGFNRGSSQAAIYRGFSTRSGFERRPGVVSLAVASTLGLSLAAYYSLVLSSLHADQPSRQIDAKTQDIDRDKEIRDLRARKSVDRFALGASKNIEGLLRQYEETHRPSTACGITRYDISQVASNDPLEDDHSEAIITRGDSHWCFFSVLDGHSGWETSAMLREELITSVINEFTGISRQDPCSSDPFAEAITRAFKQLDKKIVHKSVEQVFQTNSRTAGVDLLAPAYAGACALLAFYDAESSILRVALTGDCRAVLGRKRADGKFDLEVLTTDQTGFDPEEKKRVEAEHPGEQVVKNGRVMNFGPSRVFGDAQYKWSREVQDRLKKFYLGRSVPESVKTPPYFTAEPVVKSTDVKPGDFVVLATDGLWECLTNQEVVGLVGQWVNQRESRRTSWWNRWWDNAERADKLPVMCEGGLPKAVDDTVRYRQWGAEKRFITVDANVATHLIRNALGGTDEDLREALLSITSPRARSFRDDITATVIFFG